MKFGDKNMIIKVFFMLIFDDKCIKLKRKNIIYKIYVIKLI